MNAFARACCKRSSHWEGGVQDVLGMYCHHLLADYITLAAAPATPHGASEDDWTDGRPGPGPSALAALRPGACALFGACTAAQASPLCTCFCLRNPNSFSQPRSYLMTPICSLPSAHCCAARMSAFNIPQAIKLAALKEVRCYWCVHVPASMI